MSINSKQKYQGYVLNAITQSLTDEHDLFVGVRSGSDSSAFVIECIKLDKAINIGIFIKISNQRRSPWRYTFLRKHQESIELLNGVCDATFVIFVNDDDGVACIDFIGLKELLDAHFDDAEWISVSRKPSSSYKLKGKDGNLSGLAKRIAFPDVIVNTVMEQLNAN